MDKTNPPETVGVFKPVVHTVLVFRSTADMEAAVATLNGQGFESAAMVHYTPAEMIALAYFKPADSSVYRSPACRHRPDPCSA